MRIETLTIELGDSATLILRGVIHMDEQHDPVRSLMRYRDDERSSDLSVVVKVPPEELFSNECAIKALIKRERIIALLNSRTVFEGFPSDLFALSPRSWKALAKMGGRLWEVCTKSATAVKKTRGVGPVTFEEIQAELRRLGFDFGTEFKEVLASRLIGHAMYVPTTEDAGTTSRE